MFSSLDLPHTAFSRFTTPLFKGLATICKLTWLLLLSVIIVNVSMRHVLGEGYVQLEELQWHLNALAFMLAIVYVYDSDDHVRIDLLSEKMRPRTRAWIELYGTMLLLLPFVLLVLIYSIPFVQHSFSVGEVSPSPGGLPFRWLIKLVIPVSCSLMLIALCARLSRIWCFLVGGTPSSPETHHDGV